MTETLSPDLLESVLGKLGFAQQPAPSLESLRALYAAWCRRVPFDNVRKLIQLRAGEPGPLPGDDPTDFFTAWLEHGTGGTCWAGNGGLYALLASLGYSATRGIGTMLTSPTIPPNHGTVVVDLDGDRYLVDASILTSEPLRLDEHELTRVEHPGWGVDCRMEDGRWHIGWRPLHTPAGIDCRIEHLHATAETFSESHEGTRPWSPFNYELAVRLLTDDAVVGIGFGRHVTLNSAGEGGQEPLNGADRLKVLVEELGFSEEIARRLPPDTPTPPSPWSRSADDFGQEKSQGGG